MAADKISTRDDLVLTLAALRADGRTVVFTNGCFDLIHVGHVRYLQAARDEGDVLVVGINSDASVRAIKGDRRPIVAQQQRAEVLAALAPVDFVVVFDEPDPGSLIDAIAPDVLVKGADWAMEAIIGAERVRRNGGRVVRIDMIAGASTSGIIDTIVHRYCTEALESKCT